MLTIQWFDEKKNSLDTLEGQLKALSKSIDTVLKQRKGEWPFSSFIQY